MSNFGARPEIKWVPVDQIVVDEAYQRSVDTRSGQSVITKIATNFQWGLFGIILLTPDKTKLKRFYCVDGQHRVEAAKRAGIKEIPAIIALFDSVMAAAAAFVAINKDRTNITPLNIHRANVAAGDPAALEIERVCEAAGVRLLPYPVQAASIKPGETMAIGAIRGAIRDQGPEHASRALKMLRVVYSDSPGAIRANYITASARILSGEYGQFPGSKILADVLKRFDQPSLNLEALSIRRETKAHAADALAQVIIRFGSTADLIPDDVMRRMSIPEGVPNDVVAAVEWLRQRKHVIEPENGGKTYRIGMMRGCNAEDVVRLCGAIKRQEALEDAA